MDLATGLNVIDWDQLNNASTFYNSQNVEFAPEDYIKILLNLPAIWEELT